MKKIKPFAIIFLIALLSIQCAKKDDFSLKVCSVIGNVALISPSGEKILKQGDSVNEGDTIKTSNLSIADLVQGDAVLIRVHENTTVRVSSLLSKTNNDNKLVMEQGKMYVTLSRMKKGSFSVKTPTSVASVRGTAFRISSDRTASRLDVINGSVAVNPVKDSVIITDVVTNVDANHCASIEAKTVDAIIAKKSIAVESLKPETVKEIQAEVKDIKPEVLEKLNPDAKKEFKETISEPVQEKEAAPLPEKIKTKVQNAPVKTRQESKIEAPVIDNKNKPAPEKKVKDNSATTPANIQTL